jgi:Ca2+-binding RTX toxin-like protein
VSARERRLKRRRLAAGAGLGIGAALGTGATAQAADFTVTNLNDAGTGSLRQAVLDANANPGADRVVFQSALSGTITLTSNVLAVTGPTDFVGPGADKLGITETLAAPSQGIFYLAPTVQGTAISISGLKLTGASASNGSAILSRSSDLTLRNVIVTGNTATGVGDIYTYGAGSKLTVDSSVIDGNTGIAIRPAATQTRITRSTLSGNGVNASNNGGAIYAAGIGSTLSLDAVTMADNNGGSFGGAISLTHTATTITRSTLSGNQATGGGGAIYSNDPAGPLTIDSSTISGNGNPNFGGAISLKDNAATITNSTIAGNSAKLAGGGIYGGGDTNPVLINTVVADNTAPSAPDLYSSAGKSFSASFSLIENPAGATLTGTPNITGQDPKLGPLADNGGPTLTQALNLGSPAIDQGKASGTDQRGAPRPFDFAGVALAGDNDADIGAYERVLCGGALVNKIGTAGNDTITGTNGPDGILGLGGADLLKGLGAGDGLCGGDGKDKLKGGAGKDKLLGEAGKDKLKGGKGNDTLKGGKGNDVLIGGKGKDKLKGGPGKDKQKQ